MLLVRLFVMCGLFVLPFCACRRRGRRENVLKPCRGQPRSLPWLLSCCIMHNYSGHHHRCHWCHRPLAWSGDSICLSSRLTVMFFVLFLFLSLPFRPTRSPTQSHRTPPFPFFLFVFFDFVFLLCILRTFLFRFCSIFVVSSLFFCSIIFSYLFGSFRILALSHSHSHSYSPSVSPASTGPTYSLRPILWVPNSPALLLLPQIVVLGAAGVIATAMVAQPSLHPNKSKSKSKT